ncbi:hypothetical protein RE6C_00264 [Rhodopirellula europaea 6C]|uniref:Uncharacterized protein n=1 Tax=Rhodopirellula europaea 6C TaxID=1263867 RepID=M2BBJ6_9BACT|nr:hypothetical protein RE6C_00264 [Rhodopirellula europaea 6C]
MVGISQQKSLKRNGRWSGDCSQYNQHFPNESAGDLIHAGSAQKFFLLLSRSLLMDAEGVGLKD